MASVADSELILNLPWVPQEPERLDGLAVRRGRYNQLSYDDGITLEVQVVDPGRHRSLDGLLDEVQSHRGRTSRTRGRSDPGVGERDVTGRVGAAFHGIIGTASPPAVRCWVDTSSSTLSEVADLLGLDPASEEEANVGLSADRWRIGLHRREEKTFEEWRSTVAHPMRVWCDIRDEQRGSEFAAQILGLINDAS